MRLSNFFKIVSRYIVGIHDMNYLWTFSTKSCRRFDMEEILFTIKLPKVRWHYPFKRAFISSLQLQSA